MSRYKWWQSAVFYQIYPRSFADGNGDGIGDFQGMIRKLDYLKTLGIDALWLSPHFPSPMWDCGYDISDYNAVASEYGTLDDFRQFLDSAHEHGLHVILDLVLNHTSDKHAWFLESKSSRKNPKADWYIWYDKIPNNWQSCFDGPAWTYVPERQQYYYHYFMKQQPDLNWHNPLVKAAMWHSARFWLDMGVDGFRLDAIGTIFEHPQMPDHPVPMTLAELRHFGENAASDKQKKLASIYWYEMFMYQWGQPHALMKELRSILDEYPGDRLLVGEDDNVTYHGNGSDELHMVFNFPLIRTSCINPEWVRKNQKIRHLQLNKVSPTAWPCNTLGNHDSPRLYNHYGDGTHDAELARLNLALILTLRGTPFLYNGEEIGMTDLMILDPSQLRDTMATWYYQTLINDFRMKPEEAAHRAARMTRDKNRTPMQWENQPNGGFCPASVTPWLPVNPNYSEGVNVHDQEEDPGSLLCFYRQLLQVRKETPALILGDYRVIHPRASDYLAFLRSIEEQAVLVVLNYSSGFLGLRFTSLGKQKILHTLFSSAGRSKVEEFPSNLKMGPFEIYIAKVTG